jgi:hypothetical protein
MRAFPGSPPSLKLFHEIRRVTEATHCSAEPLHGRDSLAVDCRCHGNWIKPGIARHSSAKKWGGGSSSIKLTKCGDG